MMTDHVFNIVRLDLEDRLKFYIDDTYVGEANYDAHGRLGIIDMEMLFCDIAKKLGYGVNYEEEPETES